MFGIDLPIMELLFLLGIFSLLFGIFLLITLVVIWLEIKKMRELILTEKANIYRFEEDMTKLKAKDKAKHYKTLSEFIKAGFDRGFAAKEIKSLLVKRGWPMELVEKMLNKSKYSKKV